MTNQHRATPEQQARDMLERMGVPDAQSCTSGDLVELASLIAASQHRAAPEQWASPPASAFHADPIPVIDQRLRKLRARVEALEKAQRPLSELSRHEVVDRALRVGQEMKEAAIRRAQPMSLVERVSVATACAGKHPEIKARAAIREVAAWFRETGDITAVAASMALESEANR